MLFISEPFLLNCELLFSLAEQLQKPASEMETLEKMIHDGNSPIILVSPIDRLCWFNSNDSEKEEEQISFKADKLTIPVSLVTDDSAITVSIHNGNDITVIDDWTISEVNRDNGFPYFVSYVSKTAKKFKYQDGMQVQISIIPSESTPTETVKQEYVAKQQKTIVFNSIVFEKVE